MFGLRDSDLTEIRLTLQKFPEVEEALIYGSRAKGNNRLGSDVDLALKGKNLDYSIITEIRYILNEETLMPYFFDVLDYSSLTNRELADHINRVGKSLYIKSEMPIVSEPEEKLNPTKPR
jgi:predicted nucleotidyltransferase